MNSTNNILDNKKVREQCTALFTVDPLDTNYAPITRSYAKFFMKYLACTSTSRTNEDKWVIPFHLNLVHPQHENIILDGWEGAENLKSNPCCFFDEKTGLKISVFEDANEVIITFGSWNSGDREFDNFAGEHPEIDQIGTVIHPEKNVEIKIVDLARERAIGAVSIIQDKSVWDNLQGEIPALYSEAGNAVLALMEHDRFRGKKFVLSGLSMGGSIAQYVGLVYKVQAYCFNSLMLGKGLLNVTKENHSDAHKFIYIISTEGDKTSHLLEASMFGSVARYYGQGLTPFQDKKSIPKEATHCGRRFVVPTAYPTSVSIDLFQSMDRNHAFILRSVLNYLGYPIPKIKDEKGEEKDANQDISKVSPSDILTDVLSREEIKRGIGRIAKLRALLMKLLDHPSDDEIRRILARINEVDSNLYAMFCSSVWVALGKHDRGNFSWAHDQLQANPQILFQIFSEQSGCPLTELVNYYEFLIQVHMLFPVIKESSSQKDLEIAAEQLTYDVCNQLKIENFEVDAEHLPSFLFKLHVFLSDQLKNGLVGKDGFDEQSHIATCEKDYQIVPKEHLLANRFAKPKEAAKRILIVSFECAGVVGDGEIPNDVRNIASGLTQKGREVTLLMPKYDWFPQDKERQVQVEYDTFDSVQHFFGGKDRNDLIYRGRIGNIHALFMQSTTYEKERNPYQINDHGVYAVEGDDEFNTLRNERIGYFANAVAQLISNKRDQFDVIMFHGWNASLAIELVVTRNFQDWVQGRMPAMVYNFRYCDPLAQGGFNEELSQKLFEGLGLKGRGEINVTKLALDCADHSCGGDLQVTQDGQNGHGLEQSMRKAANLGKLTGILNGVQSSGVTTENDPVLVQWNDPKTKEACPLNFGLNGNLVDAKQKIKNQLQLWLEVHLNVTKEQVDVTKDNIIVCMGPVDSAECYNQIKAAMLAASKCGATLIVLGEFANRKDAELLEEEARKIKTSAQGWGGALILADEKNALLGSTLELGAQDGKTQGIGSLVKAIATVRFFPTGTSSQSAQVDTWLNGGLVIADQIDPIAKMIFTDVDSCGSTFTKGSNNQIFNVVTQAIQGWGYSRSIQARMSSLMNGAQLAISPVAQCEKVVDQAFEASKKRIKPINLKIWG